MTKKEYKEIFEEFASKGCKLLTSKDDFLNNNMNCKSKYKITSKCDHETEVVYDSFKSFNTGVLCKKCLPKEKKTERNGLDQEYEGFLYIKNLVINNIDIVKCCEGTKADFMIKPKNKCDNWLPIQLKTTSSPKQNYCNNYNFSLAKKDYSSMIVLCICLNDKKMWVFEGQQVNNINTITIGNKNSKYKDNEVLKENLCSKLLDYFEIGTYNKSCDIINKPISIAQQREQEYRKKREKFLLNCKFEYPEREGLVYDFIVDNYKVQEKVATINIKKRGYVVNIYRQSKAHFKPYTKGDADLYWINIPDTSMFYLIPETILIEKNIIDGLTESACRVALYPEIDKSELEASLCKTIYLNDFLYDYNDVIDAKSIQEIMLSPHLKTEISEKINNKTEHQRSRMAKARGVSITIYNAKNELLGSFPSIGEASRQLNIARSTLSLWVRNGCDKYIIKIVS